MKIPASVETSLCPSPPSNYHRAGRTLPVSLSACQSRRVLQSRRDDSDTSAANHLIQLIEHECKCIWIRLYVRVMKRVGQARRAASDSGVPGSSSICRVITQQPARESEGDWNRTACSRVEAEKTRRFKRTHQVITTQRKG